jgi:hypothetical protein
MAESLAKSATLEHVEEEDFLRFCQFAYLGDYFTPPYTSQATNGIVLPHQGLNGKDDIQSHEEELDFSRAALKKKKKKKSRWVEESEDEEGPLPSPPPPPPPSPPQTPIWTSWGIIVSSTESYSIETLRRRFADRKFCKELPRQVIFNTCEPVSNSNSTQDYTSVFLAHARLYVFADKYLVEPLKQLVLRKLHQTLVGFELYPERIGDVVELVRFVYSDDNMSGNGVNELRALVTMYIASRVQKFHESDSFLDLLQEGGDFVRDFWLVVRKSITEQTSVDTTRGGWR